MYIASVMTKADKFALAQRLRVALIRAGGDQRAIAERAGIPEQAITNIKAARRPGTQYHQALADALGVSSAWLSLGIGEPGWRSSSETALAGAETTIRKFETNLNADTVSEMVDEARAVARVAAELVDNNEIDRSVQFTRRELLIISEFIEDYRDDYAQSNVASMPKELDVIERKLAPLKKMERTKYKQIVSILERANPIMNQRSISSNQKNEESSQDKGA